MIGLMRKAMLAAMVGTFLGPTMSYGQGCLEFVTDNAGTYHDGGYSARADYVASYFTTISRRDTFNSRGEQLDNYRAVLQQDRANVNRFGKADYYMQSDTDAKGQIVEWKVFDEQDSFFTTPERRALFQSMPVIFACDASGYPSDDINSADFAYWTNAIKTGQVPAIVYTIIIALPQGGYGLYFDFVG